MFFLMFLDKRKLITSGGCCENRMSENFGRKPFMMFKRSENFGTTQIGYIVAGSEIQVRLHKLRLMCVLKAFMGFLQNINHFYKVGPLLVINGVVG